MDSEPPQRWAAMYTKQVKQKRKAYHDGALLLYPASGRLVLLDDAGDTLESRFLRASEEVSPGAALSFQAYLVDVADPEDGPAAGYTSSAPAASRTAARRGRGVARARPPSSGRAVPLRVPRSFVNPPKSSWCGGGGDAGEAAGSDGGEGAESRLQEWTALYTTQLTQKAKKYHDGFVRLVQAGPHVKQIVLLDEDGQVLGSRHLKPGESIESGKKCHFPNYLIEICEAQNQNKGAGNSSEEPVVQIRPNNRGNIRNNMGQGAMSNTHKFISPKKFQDLNETKTKVTSSSGKPDTSKVEVVATDISGGIMEADSEWNALYTTQLTQKAKKYHDGIIRLIHVGSHARQIVLLDEEGEVLGSRYLKSVESVESGTKCQLPNYLIEVCDLRNQTNESKHSSKDSLNQTQPRNEENTSDGTSGKSKSPKFVSPFKLQDVQKSNQESPAGSNRPLTGKTTVSNMNAQQNFQVISDLQSNKSDCNMNRRADYINQAFGIMDGPLKANDLRTGTATNTCPEFGKSGYSRVGDPLKFHGSGDLQDGKSGCSTISIRGEIGKSTFGNMDDSVRTASQILSIMMPPSEVRISQNAPSGQAHSLALFESRVAFDVGQRKNWGFNDSNRTSSGSSGLSHFAMQLRTSVQSCLNLETLQRKNSVRAHNWNESSGNNHPTYDHQPIMKPEDFEGQGCAVVDTLPSDMSNANEQELDSSNQHAGSCSSAESFSTTSVNSVTTKPGLKEDKSGTENQGSTQMDELPSTSAYTLTCKDPKIQELIDDCPSFDLGF